MGSGDSHQVGLSAANDSISGLGVPLSGTPLPEASVSFQEMALDTADLSQPTTTNSKTRSILKIVILVKERLLAVYGTFL